MKSSKPFIRQYVRRLSVWVILLLFLFFGSIYLFAVIVDEVLWEKEDAIDHYTFNLLSTHVINDGLTPLMEGVSFFASAPFLQVAYPVLVVLYLLQKDWKRSIEIGVVGMGGHAVNVFMKWLFKRPRPAYPLLKESLSNYGFPSGHSMSAIIFYGLLAYLVWKTDLPKQYKYLIGCFLLLFALLIGFSRVYLRVHYLSDVVAGYCIGFAWLALSIALMGWLKKKLSEEIKE
jgi:membrane-associated phospholipid phosphatase